jgi:hypothetical protein
MEMHASEGPTLDTARLVVVTAALVVVSTLARRKEGDSR